MTTSESHGAISGSRVSELLPCPFCGSPAELTVQARGVVRITCSDWKSCGMYPQIKKEAAAAIAAWNLRSEPPEPVAWLNGEREIAASWMPKLIAKLGSKPDHADDVLWLTRLHGLLFASPQPGASS